MSEAIVVPFKGAPGVKPFTDEALALAFARYPRTPCPICRQVGLLADP